MSVSSQNSCSVVSHLDMCHTITTTTTFYENGSVDHQSKVSYQFHILFSLVPSFSFHRQIRGTRSEPNCVYLACEATTTAASEARQTIRNSFRCCCLRVFVPRRRAIGPIGLKTRSALVFIYLLCIYWATVASEPQAIFPNFAILCSFGNYSSI